MQGLKTRLPSFPLRMWPPVSFPLTVVSRQVNSKAIAQSHLAFFNYENWLNVGNGEEETGRRDTERGSIRQAQYD